jgi:cytochrome c oxidase subunit II
MRSFVSLSMVMLTLTAGASVAVAQEPGLGMARPWQLGFQEAVTPSMERLVALHDLMMWIITAITLFVLALIAIACFRFQAARNPTPSRRTHHAALEIAWTVIPVLILVVIAIPSFRLLYFMDRIEEPDMTLKAIGRQWYWSYEYPDHGDFTFDAFMVPDEELQPDQPRLLAVDNEMVVPVNKNVQVIATGRPLALAIPSATNPAERSSITDTASIPSCAASVSASGALRDPGQVTAWRMPQRTSSSTKAWSGA